MKGSSRARWFSLGGFGHGPGDQKRCPNRARGYRPAQAVTDEVTTLHPTCTHPGCARPAARCDLDHVINYVEGGPTCACNMQPLCRFHHRLKTHGGWKARFTTAQDEHAPGTVEWVSRHGQIVCVPPVCLPGSNAWNPPGDTTRTVSASTTWTAPRTAAVGTTAGTDSGAQGCERGDVEEYADPRCPAEATTAERRWLRQDAWRRELNRISRIQYHGTVLPTQPPAPAPDRGEPPF